MVDVATPQPQGQGPASGQPAPAQAQAPGQAAGQGEPNAQAPGKADAKKPWMAQLKGHLQSNERLSQFDDFSSVAEEFLKFDGKRDRLIEKPGKDATDAEKAAYLNALGRPEKPEGYQFKRPSALPAGVVYSEAAEAGFRKLAHDLGLSNDVAQKLLDFDTERSVSLVKRIEGQHQEAEEARKKADTDMRATLQKEWGTKAQENATRAKQAFSTFADKEFAALLTERGLADHPLVAKHFLGLSDRIGETGFVRGGAPSVPSSPGLFDLSKTFPKANE